jgi:hypothetical protein
MRYGGYEEPFDIRDLAFTPAAPVKAIPRPIRPRRNARFAVPESGDCEDRAACCHCGRRFARDRIAKHEGVCLGTARRAVFDSQAQRLSGTEAARFFRGAATRGSIAPSNYKAEHRQFVMAMRAARRGAVPERAAVRPAPRARGWPRRGRR